jgi:hypothetical protein
VCLSLHYVNLYYGNISGLEFWLSRADSAYLAFPLPPKLQAGLKPGSPVPASKTSSLSKQLCTVMAKPSVKQHLAAIRMLFDWLVTRPGHPDEPGARRPRGPIAAGIATRISCHSFRATGITTYLQNGGKLEVAQQMARHESAPYHRALRPPQ